MGIFTGRIGKYHVAPESVYHFDKVYTGNPRNTVEMAENCKEIFNSENRFFSSISVLTTHTVADLQKK